MIGDFPASGERPVGGPQVATQRLVSKLIERGLEVVVVSPHSRSATEVDSRDEGFLHVRVPAGTRGTLARGLQPWRRNVATVLAREEVDVVHGQGLLPGGIAAGEAEGIPIVVTARGNARADTAAEYGGIGGRARGYLRNRLAERAVRRADIVVGVNPAWPVNIPVQPKRFVFIPNMVDEEFFVQRAAPEQGLVLFAGGAARAIKGWPLLAAAWPSVCEQIPEARLNAIGWTTEADAASDMPPRYRHTVHQEPWLSSADLAGALARAAVVVIPSEFEVSPIVLAEAWAVGVPVVAVPVGGIPPLATGAAVLVERRPETLADGIAAALRGEGVEQVVAEGRRRVEAFRPEAVASANIAIYDDLVRPHA